MSFAGEVWAVVPVKGGARAKERLSSVLSPSLRRALTRAMADDVLRALAASQVLDGILVVTPDPSIASIARGHGASVLTESAGEGYTEAVHAAVRAFARRDIGAMLSLPGDVPLVVASDVDAIVTARRATRDFVIVPSRDRRGSNAILCAPPHGVPLRFGDDSFAAHLRAAQAAGVEPLVLSLPNVEIDLDVPADLEHFLARPSATASRRVLEEAAASSR